jgi:DNA polymerase V
MIIKIGEEAIVSNIYLPQRLKEQNLPLFLESVSAGFPSPADVYLEGKIDLNEYLIHNPAATFFCAGNRRFDERSWYFFRRHSHCRPFAACKKQQHSNSGSQRRVACQTSIVPREKLFLVAEK